MENKLFTIIYKTYGVKGYINNNLELSNELGDNVVFETRLNAPEEIIENFKKGIAEPSECDKFIVEYFD